MAIALRQGTNGDLQRFSAADLFEVPGDLQVDGVAYYDTWQSLTPSAGAVTVDFSSYQAATVALNAATVAITLTSPPGPGAFKLILQQDATGDRAVTWTVASAIYAPNGTISTSSGTDDILVGLVFDGTDWWVTSAQPMQAVT